MNILGVISLYQKPIMQEMYVPKFHSSIKNHQVSFQSQQQTKHVMDDSANFPNF